MDICRCGDIPPIDRDIRRLQEMSGRISEMQTSLDETDRGLQSVKDAISAGAEVSLAGVAADRYSRTGREQLSIASAAIRLRIDELTGRREGYVAEDRRYHERIAAEALQRQRETERRQREYEARLR